MASDWLADSTATTHIARDRSNFIDYKDESSQIEGITPGAVLKRDGQSTVPLKFKINKTIYLVTLTDVKHAPAAPNNLISVGRLTNKGCTTNFTAASVEFKSSTGVIFDIGWKVGRMYQMRVRPKKLAQELNFVTLARSRTLDKWHQVLGHVNVWTIKTMHDNNLVTGDKSQGSIQCATCIQGKQHVDPFPKETQMKVQNIGDLVLSNVWGPAQTEGLAWERYFYSFTNARSAIYFGNAKDVALKNFAMFKKFIETQSGYKVKAFQSNNGGEYVNKPFKEFCINHGIIMETTCYTPCNTVPELRSLLPLDPCLFPRPLLHIHYFSILYFNFDP